MLTQKTYIRITVFIIIVLFIGVLGYPYLMEKVAENGYSNLLQLSIQMTVKEVSKYELDWGIVKYLMIITFLGLGLEAILLGWSRSSLKRLIRLEDKSTANDLFYFFIYLLQIGGLMRFLLTFGVAAIISMIINKLGPDLQLMHSIDSVFLQYLTAFLVMDFMGYLQHRLAHSWGWWWELHKIHHSAEKLNMITFTRTHILESIPRGILYGIAISITGHWSSFIFYFAILEFISMLVHSEILYSWGWIGKYILISPRIHKIHHSKDPEHHDKNFGFTLVLWDRIFGTFYQPKDGQEIEIGLVDNPFNKSNPVSDFLLAYKNSLKAMFEIKDKNNQEQKEEEEHQLTSLK